MYVDSVHTRSCYRIKHSYFSGSSYVSKPTHTLTWWEHNMAQSAKGRGLMNTACKDEINGLREV